MAAKKSVDLKKKDVDRLHKIVDGICEKDATGLVIMINKKTEDGACLVKEMSADDLAALFIAASRDRAESVVARMHLYVLESK
jgi:hypothetical protein